MTQPADLLREAVHLPESEACRWRAEHCFRECARLPVNDLARPEWLSAAQTFALLAIAAELSAQTRKGKKE